MEGLHGHFADQRVETHMYASQWFLTIYTAKFPISMVFRIMDVYLCEVREAFLALCTGRLGTAVSPVQGPVIMFQIALGILKVRCCM